jgi:hypothetical protein
MTMGDIPFLTKRRWACLVALKRNKALQRREFLAGELVVEGRNGHPFTATGATLVSLREAGWVDQVVVGGHGEKMPFRTGGPARAWRVTEAGLKAIAACPDTFPGEPVYEGNTDRAESANRAALGAN